MTSTYSNKITTKMNNNIANKLMNSLFSNKLTSQDNVFGNHMTENEVEDTYFYSFDFMNKSTISKNLQFYYKQGIQFKMSNSSTDPEIPNNLIQLNTYCSEKYKEQNKTNVKIYLLCPTYYDNTIKRFSDSQYFVSGKCLRNPINNNIYPLITAFQECIEEVGIVPNIEKLLFQKISFNETKDENNRIIQYITFAIDIADCHIYYGSVEDFDFLPNAGTTIFDEFSKNNNENMIVYKKINYRQIKNAIQLNEIVEDRDIRIQIMIFGTHNNFHEMINQIQNREVSKDYNTLLGLRLIPLDKTYNKL